MNTKYKLSLIALTLFTCFQLPALALSATVTGQAYTSAFPKCYPNAIPDAIHASTTAAIEEAEKICEEVIISSVRILGLNPIACNGWSAGYEPRVEISFSCAR
jgi:hypothetical protein